ncbi:MAG: hypothetical protein DBX55_01265 [Verrucomicrobia bacterium]|nr:MAG: hypothetical protein DBX55_01265 [Verrucomicrobiota bacterium]
MPISGFFQGPNNLFPNSEDKTSDGAIMAKCVRHSGKSERGFFGGVRASHSEFFAFGIFGALFLRVIFDAGNFFEKFLFRFKGAF